MDLALALGRDIRSMTERDFRQWISYARTKSLPYRRLEYGLAMVAYMIAVHVGHVQNVTIADFMFDRPTEKETTDDVDIEAIKQMMGFDPRG